MCHAESKQNLFNLLLSRETSNNPGLCTHLMGSGVKAVEIERMKQQSSWILTKPQMLEDLITNKLWSHINILSLDVISELLDIVPVSTTFFSPPNVSLCCTSASGQGVHRSTRLSKLQRLLGRERMGGESFCKMKQDTREVAEILVKRGLRTLKPLSYQQTKGRSDPVLDFT